MVQQHPGPQRTRTRSLTIIAIVSGVLLVTLLHYLTSAHLLPYHAVYRSLYYLPITIAAVRFGVRGGLIISVICVLLYLPHVLGMGEVLPGGMLENLIELPLFVIVAAVVGSLADRERLQRRRSETLQVYVDTVLQSLPLGVATADTPDGLAARNRSAANLLHRSAIREALLPLETGYHTLEQICPPLGVHISALVDPEGTPTGRVFVLEDLTERRALETQLRRMDRLAAVGQLAAGIAHEVRNPLAIVRATAQLLAVRLRDVADLSRYATVLTDESDRIEQLVGGLLDYAKPRQPVLETLDLAETLSTAVHSVEAYALQQQVVVHAEPPPIGTLVADPQQIQQLLLNLLLNALQASHPGGQVRLKSHCRDGQVVLQVIDGGRGMQPDELERACDPFFTTRTDGTGLGLALVATIVSEHAGTLRIESTSGSGTTVTVTLPNRPILHMRG